MHGQMVMDILNVVHADSSNSSNTYSVTNFLNIVFHIFQIDFQECMTNPLICIGKKGKRPRSY